MHHDSITPGLDAYLKRGEALSYWTTGHNSGQIRFSLRITCGRKPGEPGGDLTANGDTFGQALRRLESYCGEISPGPSLTPGIDRHLQVNPTDVVELQRNESGRWTIRICVRGGLPHGWVSAGTLGRAIATMETMVSRRYVAVVAA